MRQFGISSEPVYLRIGASPFLILCAQNPSQNRPHRRPFAAQKTEKNNSEAECPDWLGAAAFQTIRCLGQVASAARSQVRAAASFCATAPDAPKHYLWFATRYAAQKWESPERSARLWLSSNLQCLSEGNLARGLRGFRGSVSSRCQI
jgi:hypothetical protein